jgi:hypothetical protein
MHLGQHDISNSSMILSWGKAAFLHRLVILVDGLVIYCCLTKHPQIKKKIIYNNFAHTAAIWAGFSGESFSLFLTARMVNWS